MATLANLSRPLSCRALAQWTIDNEQTAQEEAQFKAGASEKRRTSRNIPKDHYELPPLAYQIRDRIYDLFPKPRPPLAFNRGKDGIVIVTTYPGGDSVDHLDPQPLPGVDLLRANIIVQAAESGGELRLEDEPIDIKQGDLHLYVVSWHAHGVRTVHGKRPRIIWLFGFCINGNDWDTGRWPSRPLLESAEHTP